MKKEIECGCKNWEENIKVINSSLVLSWGHGFEGLKKPFIFCPYCGNRLESKKYFKQDAISKQSEQEVKNG